jgi:hypothetical protein
MFETPVFDQAGKLYMPKCGGRDGDTKYGDFGGSCFTKTATGEWETGMPREYYHGGRLFASLLEACI